MPTIPSKWLADSMLKLFSKHVHNCEVTEIEYLTKSIKRLQFKANTLKNIVWKPGMEVEFRVNDTEFRHYTASDWNNDEGTVDVLVYLHQFGPGSRLLTDLSVGDHIQLLGPGGRFLFNFGYHEYVFLGDETSIGLFLAFQRSILPKAKFRVAIEYESEDFPEISGLDVKSIKSTPTSRGMGLLHWLDSAALSTTDCLYYLVGNAATNKILQTRLKTIGISPSLIKIKAYWMEGKKGL